MTNCRYTFSNANGIEKPHNFCKKKFNFVQFNHKNHCCNVSLNIMMRWWKYSTANILNCCVISFQIWKQWKNHLEASNFSVLVDCSNKENSEKVIKEGISRQYITKKYLSHITDKSVPVVMSLFLLFLLLFLLIVFISLAFHLQVLQGERFYISTVNYIKKMILPWSI